MINICKIIVILSCIGDGQSKIYQVSDYLKPDFDISDLDVLDTFLRENKECSEVTEKVMVLEYPFMGEKGEVNRENLTVVTMYEEEEVEVYYNNQNNSLVHKMKIRPALNCLDQEDPKLIQQIKDHYLVQPSDQPYQLTSKGPWPADGQPHMLDQRYFHEKKKGGFFVEAGAFDGESDSTTLHFEMSHAWSGLLVEPVPRYFDQIGDKHRKAWSTQTCLSTKRRPETIRFNNDHDIKSVTMQGIISENSKEDLKSIKMQCLPLYSLLLALGNPTVDFLSLDIEGPEFQVLSNLPWDKVDIRTISVETQFAGETGLEGTRQEIINLLTSVGYLHLGNIARDDVFVKLDPTDICPKLLIEELVLKENLRMCKYFRLEKEELSGHCKRNYPRDFFKDGDVTKMPSCLKLDTCPADLPSLVQTYQASSHWKNQLSDGCMYSTH